MTRAEVQRILAQAGLRLRRSAGQNFLLDEGLARAIASDGGIQPDDVVLEVGTGLGILTRELCSLARHVVSVEIDGGVFAVASELLADLDNLSLVHRDALASKRELAPEVLEALRAELGEAGRLRVVANLPYNVATTLVLLLLGADLPLDMISVMVQLEAAQRFAARPGSEAYGAVSLVCWAATERVEVVRRVPPDVFFPKPKVTSAVVRLTPRADVDPQEHARLTALVRGLFNYRRKTVHKAAKLAAKQDPTLAWVPEAVRDFPEGFRTEDLGLDETWQILGLRRT